MASLTENQKKLMDKLTEMFQFDQADLDFGIYRIMNYKRDEIRRFLENDLMSQISEKLAVLARSSNKAEQMCIRDRCGLGWRITKKKSKSGGGP